MNGKAKQKQDNTVDKEVEACDIVEAQTVRFDGVERRVESVDIHNGKVLTVEIKMEGIDPPYKFTEGDYLTVVDGDPD